MKVQVPEPGGIAVSTAGRDKDRLYFILRVEKDRVIVCDGRLHTVRNPKRKNVRHLSLKPVFFPEIAERVRQGKEQDSEIRAALKQAAQTLKV